MDGTLLGSDHATISRENIRAVTAALAAGVAVVPATGRILSRLACQLAALPPLSFAIVCNGAELAALSPARVLDTVSFTPGQALSLLADAKSAGVPAMVYQAEQMLVSPADLAALRALPHQRAHMNGLLELQCEVADFAARFAQNPDRIVKLNLPVVSPEKRDELSRRWSALPWVQVTSSLPGNLELGPAGATKGAGLLRLCRAIGISPDEVMAIGDGENDLSMFAVAAFPVAMANGCPAAKAAARYLTDSNENDGVAQAIFAVLEGRWT